MGSGRSLTLDSPADLKLATDERRRQADDLKIQAIRLARWALVLSVMALVCAAAGIGIAVAAILI